VVSWPLSDSGRGFVGTGSRGNESLAQGRALAVAETGCGCLLRDLFEVWAVNVGRGELVLLLVC
jgi:hypothetical protein